MSIPLTTIGAKISVGVFPRSTVTTPTYDGTLVEFAATVAAGSWYHIPKAYEMSEFDFEPDNIEVTSFDELKNKAYTHGLADTSGVQTISVRGYSDELAEKLWDAVCDALTGTDISSLEDDNCAWLCVDIARKPTKYLIPIDPIKVGMPSIPLNDNPSINLKYTIAGDIETTTLA